jgi:hypothetical protein
LKACGIYWAGPTGAASGQGILRWWNWVREKDKWTLMASIFVLTQKQDLDFSRSGNGRQHGHRITEIWVDTHGVLEKFLRPKNDEDFNAYVKNLSRTTKACRRIFVMERTLGQWWNPGWTRGSSGRRSGERFRGTLPRRVST